MTLSGSATLPRSIRRYLTETTRLMSLSRGRPDILVSFFPAVRTSFFIDGKNPSSPALQRQRPLSPFWRARLSTATIRVLRVNSAILRLGSSVYNRLRLLALSRIRCRHSGTNGCRASSYGFASRIVPVEAFANPVGLGERALVFRTCLGNRHDAQSALGDREGCRRAGRHSEDLRRTICGAPAPRLCHLAGGELDQIQFLSGTRLHPDDGALFGVQQKLRCAVNDKMGIEP